MASTTEMCVETLRMGARTAKAIAVQKYRAGDLAGAKAYALKAKELNPVLTGLHRLNAVLDLLLGSEKKINGEVDWYAVLGVDPTADIETIQRRHRKLLLSILMDDGDDSVGSVVEAKSLMANSHRFLCYENNRELYDKRRQERADQEKQQQLMRASQGPSFTCAPVVLSAPNQPQRVSEANERMVQPSSRTFVQVPVTLSPPPPQRPMMFNGETEKMFEVKVGQHSQLPPRISLDDLRRATQVLSSNSSVPEPVVQSQRQKMFNEENEEIVEISVEEFAQALLPSSSPGGENKRKAPMSLLHANQLRRISEDAGIKSIEGRCDYVVPSVTKPSLESASQYVNVASSSATRAPQESKMGNAVYASRQHVNVAFPSALNAPQESYKFNGVYASHQHVNIASSSATKAPQESNMGNAVYASRQHVNTASSSAPKAPQESNMGNAVYASRQHVNIASSSAPKAPQESNTGNAVYASRQHVNIASFSAPKAPQESNMGNALYASRQHVNIASSSAPKAPQESNMGNAFYASRQHLNIASSSATRSPQESNKGSAVYASRQHVNIASASAPKAPQESNMGNAANRVNIGSKYIFYMNKQAYEQVCEIKDEKMD